MGRWPRTPPHVRVLPVPSLIATAASLSLPEREDREYKRPSAAQCNCVFGAAASLASPVPPTRPPRVFPGAGVGAGEGADSIHWGRAVPPMDVRRELF